MIGRAACALAVAAARSRPSSRIRQAMPAEPARCAPARQCMRTLRPSASSVDTKAKSGSKYSRSASSVGVVGDASPGFIFGHERGGSHRPMGNARYLKPGWSAKYMLPSDSSWQNTIDSHPMAASCPRSEARSASPTQSLAPLGAP